jgi:hypothetical protein
LNLVLSAFFHPDYTVGPGASPGLPRTSGTLQESRPTGLAGCTADRELVFHPSIADEEYLTLP